MSTAAIGQPRLVVGVDLEPAGERVFVRGNGRQDGAAVRAADDAAALQLGEIAAGGHRRHAEALLDLGDGHGAVCAKPFGDLAAAGLGEHAGAFI